MTFLFAFVVFCSLVVFFCLTSTVTYLLVQLDIVKMEVSLKPYVGQLLASVITVSLPVGAIVSAVASKVPLKPVRNLINSMDRLASGDFKTRVNVGPVMKKYPAFVQLTESFNKMAAELENTEVLRSDFINNFSHEFKTPIVSIAGFAKLLKREDLTQQQRTEYLDIIEEESLRLSYMATNVLNLTKVENQTILTDVTSFNLSEQLRSCVLLLETKWAKKNLAFHLEFEEYRIRANEELLKQVWINLIDNAIKFSADAGEILINIDDCGKTYRVSITNYGVDIPQESQKKIFNKFYQADESHADEGNGIGLAIVKKIAQLHQGSADVESGNGVTNFTVTLPKNKL